MADLYNAPQLLNYYCLNECPIGCRQSLSDKVLSIDRVTVKLLKSLKVDELNEVKDMLVDIAADGIISDEENGSQERTISEIKKYIKSNLGRSLSLDEIANHVNYNSTYISRLFRQLTGENISRYIVEQKIEKAKEYLSETNESIQTISEKLGFETSQYFSNVFKKRTGISPREYRNLSLYH